MNGEALWELQQLDTSLNQLQRRLTKLPEAAALADADRRVTPIAPPSPRPQSS